MELHDGCTDTTLWARACVESGRWLSTTFCCACFLPFDGQLLMQLFYGACGYTEKVWGRHPSRISAD